jgi:hypothetical protein
MYTIAQKFGVSLPALIAANPRLKDPNVIYPGQVLTVPAAGSPGPSPEAGWCCLMLRSVHPMCKHGTALIRRDAHIMVAADLPDPSEWTDCEVYTAWVMDDGADPAALFCFDLLHLKGTGFWINQHSPRTMPIDGEVVVTVESQGHPMRPMGQKVLRGNLRNCCRSDP